MKLLIPILVAGSLLGGCFVRTNPQHHRHEPARVRSCPAGYHWDHGDCVSNGRRDHRR
jgi:hypothetical protein